MNECDIVLHFLNDTLNAQYDKSFALEGLNHQIAVAQIAALLAMKQNIDPNLAQIAGYLHDIAFYTSHYHPDHAKRSAKIAFDFLKEKTTLHDSAIQQIVTAIALHSNKGMIDDPLCEIIKDADVISHVISDGTKGLDIHQIKRLEKYLS